MARPIRLLLALAACFLLEGVVEPFLPNAEQPLNEALVVESLISAILLFAWCNAHAAQRGIVPPRGAVILVAVLPPLGLPLYFFRSMPWRQAGLATLKALGCFVVLSLLFEAGFYLGSCLH